ncbi:MAG: hypothetical protein ACRERR_09515 [Moraxellaceae bacterium]
MQAVLHRPARCSSRKPRPGRAHASADFSSRPAHVHVYVPDVDACSQRALAAGATSLQAPLQKTDADKRGGAQDAGGSSWWIATKLE